MAGGAVAAAGGLLWLEFLIPSLLLCWFCCWNDNTSESSSTEGHPLSTPIIRTDLVCHSRGFKQRRRSGSATGSLRLSSHSRDSPLQTSHHSHEELRGSTSRWGAGGCEGVGAEAGEGGSTRYNSAPSVLREVLHRRDWDTQLHARDADFIFIPLTDTPRPSYDLEAARTCKKHYTNIKSSKKKLSKEDSRNQDPKDFEEPPAYTDDNEVNPTINVINITENPYAERDINVDEVLNDINNDIIINRQTTKTQFKAKEAKQSYNESVKHRNSMKIKRNSEVNDSELVSIKGSEGMELPLLGIEGSALNDGADACGDVEKMSMRSGAMHHGSKDSLATCHSKMDYPRASVEAVSYSVAACYLHSCPPSVLAAEGASAGPEGGRGRGRLASDGDILETSHRPHSTAFSESDLELELEISASIERPPPYCHTKESNAATPATHTTTRRKETAL